jgi:hypothetical protein
MFLELNGVIGVKDKGCKEPPDPYDVKSGGCVEKVGAIEDSADTAGCGLDFYGAGRDECCG